MEKTEKMVNEVVVLIAHINRTKTTIYKQRVVEMAETEVKVEMVEVAGY
jgi:hypothetical protein